LNHHADVQGRAHPNFLDFSIRCNHVMIDERKFLEVNDSLEVDLVHFSGVFSRHYSSQTIAMRHSLALVMESNDSTDVWKGTYGSSSSCSFRLRVVRVNTRRPLALSQRSNQFFNLGQDSDTLWVSDLNCSNGTSSLFSAASRDGGRFRRASLIDIVSSIKREQSFPADSSAFVQLQAQSAVLQERRARTEIFLDDLYRDCLRTLDLSNTLTFAEGWRSEIAQAWATAYKVCKNRYQGAGGTQHLP
jgi:hypothetical protein